MRRKVEVPWFVVVILGYVFTPLVSGKIIPAAKQAKTNAEPYLHTDVIITGN